MADPSYILTFRINTLITIQYADADRFWIPMLSSLAIVWPYSYIVMYAQGVKHG